VSIMVTMNTKIIEKTGVVAYIDGMPKKEYTAVYKKSGKWIIARIKEVPGAITQERTMKEANESLYEVLTLMLEVNHELGYSPSLDLTKESFIIKTKD
jgi:predicted RNase H-like HicB family nuclease